MKIPTGNRHVMGRHNRNRARVADNCLSITLTVRNVGHASAIAVHVVTMTCVRGARPFVKPEGNAVGSDVVDVPGLQMNRRRSAVGAVSCRPDHHRVLATDDAADICAICVGHRGIYCAYSVLER